MAYSFRYWLDRVSRPNYSLGGDRWGDSGEIYWRFNLPFTRGIRAIRGGPITADGPPPRESIHSLSMCGWLSLEHKLMNFGPDVRDGAPDNAYSRTRNYGITLIIWRVTEGSYYTSLFCFPRGSIGAAIDESYTSGVQVLERLLGEGRISDLDIGITPDGKNSPVFHRTYRVFQIASDFM